MFSNWENPSLGVVNECVYPPCDASDKTYVRTHHRATSLKENEDKFLTAWWKLKSVIQHYEKWRDTSRVSCWIWPLPLMCLSVCMRVCQAQWIWVLIQKPVDDAAGQDVTCSVWSELGLGGCVCWYHSGWEITTRRCQNPGNLGVTMALKLNSTIHQPLWWVTTKDTLFWRSHCAVKLLSDVHFGIKPCGWGSEVFFNFPYTSVQSWSHS